MYINEGTNKPFKINSIAKDTQKIIIFLKTFKKIVFKSLYAL